MMSHFKIALKKKTVEMTEMANTEYAHFLEITRETIVNQKSMAYAKWYFDALGKYRHAIKVQVVNDKVIEFMAARNMKLDVAICYARIVLRRVRKEDRRQVAVELYVVVNGQVEIVTKEYQDVGARRVVFTFHNEIFEVSAFRSFIARIVAHLDIYGSGYLKTALKPNVPDIIARKYIMDNGPGPITSRRVGMILLGRMIPGYLFGAPFGFTGDGLTDISMLLAVREDRVVVLENRESRLIHQRLQTDNRFEFRIEATSTLPGSGIQSTDENRRKKAQWEKRHASHIITTSVSLYTDMIPSKWLMSRYKQDMIDHEQEQEQKEDEDEDEDEDDDGISKPDYDPSVNTPTGPQQKKQRVEVQPPLDESRQIPTVTTNSVTITNNYAGITHPPTDKPIIPVVPQGPLVNNPAPFITTIQIPTPQRPQFRDLASLLSAPPPPPAPPLYSPPPVPPVSNKYADETIAYNARCWKLVCTAASEIELCPEDYLLDDTAFQRLTDKRRFQLQQYRMAHLYVKDIIDPSTLRSRITQRAQALAANDPTSLSPISNPLLKN